MKKQSNPPPSKDMKRPAPPPAPPRRNKNINKTIVDGAKELQRQNREMKRILQRARKLLKTNRKRVWIDDVMACEGIIYDIGKVIGEE